MFCYEGAIPAIGRGQRGVLGATAWLVQEGWASVRDAGGRPIRARAGEWLLARPGQRMQEFSDDARVLSVNFRAAFHTGENLFEEGLSTVLAGDAHPQLERRARNLLRVSNRELGPEWSRWIVTAPVDLRGYLVLHRALTDWILAWSTALMEAGIMPQTIPDNDARVKQAFAFLQGHLKEPNLNWDKVAAGVGLSLSQLNRHLLRERGETLRQVHQKMRREHARHLLTRSGLSIKEISGELGFRYPSHFTAWFRKNCGLSPSEFRQNPVVSRYFPASLNFSQENVDSDVTSL